MIELMNKVRRDVESELLTACEKYNLFASRHEGLAVIEEEVWETHVAFTKVKSQFDIFRYDVFTDEYESLTEDVQELKERAINVACEAIQVAAMCDKWRLGRGDSNAEADDSLFAKLP